MKRPHWRLICIMTAAALACGNRKPPPCSRFTPCLDDWIHAVTRSFAFSDMLLLLGALLLVTLLARAVWLVRSAERCVRIAPSLSWNDALRTAVERTRAERVVYLDTEVPAAWCAGSLHPHIVVTQGLVACLENGELDAVLLHERQHSERRDPLLYALRKAAADVCFFAPLVGWWAEHQRQNAELRADRAAMHALGQRPLARALLTAGAVVATKSAAAFAGAVDLRVAQVLGDALPPRRPPLALWVASTAGLAAVSTLVSCVTHILATAT